MKLFSWRFVRLLRGRVRSQLRGSKKLWKEYKRRREGRWGKVWRAGFVVFVVTMGPVALLGRLDLRPELLLLLLTLYATGTPLLRLASFRVALSDSFERALLRCLPLSDADFFQFTWQRFLRSSLLVLYVAALVYLYVAVKLERIGSAGLAIVACAGLQWLSVVAATLLLYRFRLRPPALVALVLYGLGILLCFVPIGLQRQVGFLTGWLPAGWIHGLFGYASQGRVAVAATLVALLAGLTTFVWFQARSLRRAYSEAESVPPLSAQEFEGAEELEIAEDQPRPSEWHVGRDRFAALRAEESIRAGAFSQPSDWASAGWVERVVAAWLTERERRVADFLLGGVLPFWTPQWRRAAWVFSASILACLVFPFLPRWIFYVLLLVGAAFGAPFLGGSWMGFESRYTGTSLSPIYAAYPVVYSELSSVMLKTNAVRFAAWFPLYMAYAAALSWPWQVPVAYSLVVHVSLLFVLAASQPLVIAARISRRTNDTRETSRTSLALAIVGFAGILLYLPLAVALVVPVPLPWKLLLAAVFLALCTAGWWFYGWLFNRGQIDMLHQPGS